MKSRQALTVFLAVVLVPIALGFAGASVKAAILSISVFWVCLGIFFYPSISDYLRSSRRERDDPLKRNSVAYSLAETHKEQHTSKDR